MPTDTPSKGIPTAPDSRPSSSPSKPPGPVHPAEPHRPGDTKPAEHGPTVKPSKAPDQKS